MTDIRTTKEKEALLKAAKDDFDRINALPDSERRQAAIQSIYGGIDTFSSPDPVSIDDKVHAVSLASEVPGHEKRGVIGHYKIHHNGDREGTVLGNWDWERVVADAGLTGKWMVLHFADAADFERDWSLLEATQDSLREHANLLKQRDAELAKLRARVAELESLGYSAACRLMAVEDALSDLADYVDERQGDNECRPLENARRALSGPYISPYMAAIDRICEVVNSAPFSAIGHLVEHDPALWAVRFQAARLRKGGA